MPATFNVEFKGDYVEVHSDGDKDLEFAARLLSDAVATCRRHNCYRILGMANTTSPLAIVDGFDLAKMFQEFGMPPIARIAWVEPNPDGFEAIKFVETVLFNRSIASFKVFDDELAAREWLFSDRGV
jgi:hypothetical protein